MRCQIFVKNRAFTKSAPTFSTSIQKDEKDEKDEKGEKDKKKTKKDTMHFFTAPIAAVENS